MIFEPDRCAATHRTKAASGGSADTTIKEVSTALADKVHEQVEAHPWIHGATQVGWVAKGVVYGALGWAAIEISLAKSAADDAAYTGIVTALSAGAFTRFLLAVIAVGLVFYIGFRLLSVALIDEVDVNAWAHRVGYLASAATYVTIAWAAGSAVIDGVSETGESKVERVSKALLGSGLGRFALVVFGAAAFGVAIYFVYKGVTRRFMSQIETASLGPVERRVIEYSGAAGWVGRGLTVVVVASFVTWAAIDSDPNDVRGIDSAMHRVANGNAGQLVVFGLGLCLLIYAFFCVLSARRRRMAWDGKPEPTSELSPNMTWSEQ